MIVAGMAAGHNTNADETRGKDRVVLFVDAVLSAFFVRNH